MYNFSEEEKKRQDKKTETETNLKKTENSIELKKLEIEEKKIDIQARNDFVLGLEPIFIIIGLFVSGILAYRVMQDFRRNSTSRQNRSHRSGRSLRNENISMTTIN